MPKVQNYSAVAIDGLTEFEAHPGPSSETTTSNGWVTKSEYPYTSTLKSAGKYVIDYSAQLGQSKTGRLVGIQIQWRLGTSGTWNTLAEVITSFGADDAYGLFSGFNEVTLPSDTVIQIQINWGQTTTGFEGLIKEANIKIGKAAEL